MKKLMIVALLGLFSTVAFANDSSSTGVLDPQEKIKYECKFRKKSKRPQECHVRGRICFGIAGDATTLSGHACNDGGITQKIKCDDGFELRDPRLDVYLGVIAPPQRLFITYAKEDENEAYIHINPFNVNDKGVKAKLTTIVNDSDVDHYVGRCDIVDGQESFLD